MVIKPEKIKEIKFDYVIIASQYNKEIFEQLKNTGVKEELIFQFYKFSSIFETYIKKTLSNYLENKHEKYKAVFTGISYFYKGILTEYFDFNVIKLAFPSQDLYYDFKMAKCIINEIKNGIGYCFIGLSYYSFQYDLSLSALWDRTNLYYDLFNDSHNYEGISTEEELDLQKFIATQLLDFDSYGNIKFTYSKVKKELRVNELEGKIQSERDCNKNYPKTVTENIDILEEYIKYLNSKNIKPIILVAPASKWYNKNFSRKIENEFKSNIEQMVEKYKIEFWDYFRDDRFEIDDFEDVTHLNLQGAKKFSCMINERIKEMDNNN